METALAVSSLAVSVISVLSLVYWTGYKFASLDAASKILAAELAGQHSTLSVKVDTMWAYQMRRGFAEAIERGVAAVNSPLKFTNESIAALNPVASALKHRWQEDWHQLSDLETLLEIEKEFGDDILKLVCVPYKLTYGSCLILALAVAKNAEGTAELKLFNLAPAVKPNPANEEHKP